MKRPFILVVPTYARGDGTSPVPPQVIRFLNIQENRDMMVGIIGCGNRNFGDMFCIGARVISDKCNRPLLHCVELSGVDSDIDIIRNIVGQTCKQN